jgi:hypothetical protein
VEIEPMDRPRTLELGEAFERYGEHLYARWLPAKKHRCHRYRAILGLGLCASVFYAAFRIAAPMTMAFAIISTQTLSFCIRRARAAPQRLRDLAPEPAADASYPASVSLLYGDRTYGGDEGMVTLSDGWILFEGERFSCSIRLCDASRGGDMEILTLSCPGRRSMRIAFYKRWEHDTKIIDLRPILSGAREVRDRSPRDGVSIYPPRQFPNRARLNLSDYGVAVALALGSLTCGAFALNAGIDAPMLVFFAILLAPGAVCAVALQRSDAEAHRELQPPT